MKRAHWIGLLPYYLLTVIVIICISLWGSRGVTVSVQNTPVERYNTLIIDPGHGGIDGGATSCTGVLESQINLQIGLRLRDLMHLLGYHTVMTRTTDTSIHTHGNTIAAQKVSDLKNRVKLVEETPNAIYIGIHQNIFADSRYHGAQVFYGNEDESKTLAHIIQQKLCPARQCKPGEGIYLLQNIHAPGVLVECGFLSNPAEEAKLRDTAYQKWLCAVIAESLREFMSCSS